MNPTELLLKLGFSSKEANVYITLLQRKRATYNKLAELAGINRTTCYGVVKKLIEQGLITENLGAPIVELLPKPASNLVSRLQKQQIELNKQIELAKRTAQELEQLAPYHLLSEPHVVYVEEKDINDYLYQRTELWNKSIKQYDAVIWGFESARFESDYQDYIKWFWERPDSKGVSVKLFSDEPDLRNSGVNPVGTADFQFVPDINFTTNIWIYGDYTILLSLEEHPNYLLELKEPLLTKNLRQFFQALWKATASTWDAATRTTDTDSLAGK